MKRLLAKFALAAILSTFALPLVASLQKPEIPACCLPGGKHHCTQNSTGTGFKSQTDPCPYASQFLAAGLTGLYLARFEMAALGVGDFTTLIRTRPRCRIAVRHLSDRGPPTPFALDKKRFPVEYHRRLVADERSSVFVHTNPAFR